MPQAKPPKDVYLKKTFTFDHEGHTLRFRVAQDLFSSHRVDIGTHHLLKSLADADTGSVHKLLDLGCGYGPLGLTLKKLDSTRDVHLVDRDALAVAYTRQNAALNAVADVVTYGSLGYDDVRDRDYDLIVSNLPGKAGLVVIEHLLLDARHYLRADGWVAVVVVKALESLVAELLRRDDVEVTYHEAWGAHAVFHYRFREDGAVAPPSEGGFERGVYQRELVDFIVGDTTFVMETAQGLSEFDTLSYDSDLTLYGLGLREAEVQRAVAFNPGQGHVPLVLWQRHGPQELLLIDRDLLSLRTTRRNLIRNGCAVERLQMIHQVGLRTSPEIGADVIVGVLREDEGREAVAATVRQAAAHLAPEGTLVVAAGSTPITRVEKRIKAEKLLRVRKRKRYKGYSVLVLGDL